MKGLSLTLCFGKYGGFYVYVSSTSWRICLGWMAVTLYFLDLEEFITVLRKRIESLEDS